MFSSRLVLSLPKVVTLIDGSSNVIYENGTAKRLLTDEGYVDLTTNTYYYYLKDHQGNNRVVINSSGSVVETNHYYPFGGLFSTSTNVQPYKYNGKEFDTKKGLNLYDYGARHYDAALGRFTTFDPLSEKDYLNVPYGYCGNNPIIRIDRDGKAWDTIWDFGNLLYDVGAAIYNHIQGDHAQAQSHWKDAGADALAMAVPFVPAGVTKLKYADDVVDAAKATNKVDNAADAANKFKIVIPDKDKIDRNLLNPPTKPGNAPTFKSDGTPVEIHHVNQNPNGPFIEMNIKEHRGKGVDKINHPQKGDATNIDRNEFNKAKKEYWKNEYQDYFNQQHRK